ncbi:bifunctional diaminohydroxyphosphoribosylaminopyrimidine deaminase/5-amino-6-(5-phosphoribosylamino)uracil reductase RibD [Sphingomonas naphthae]|uniref:Riboflavin biosynthesis protein RibD n=1 Tax=Sphingomonas naphthae TaxID=1813468 RepID=A0ABY7TL62_9SPHN|nr:bifunctional diaminohydroxyphosphoribosylaminopyrimidine deaminase/5-amino-6-(5-phosphoribosylamino)uracil reductase RibD [Sphingomonas naphthae]WCT72989.1 bifunctional diaminohydroxyphosphoribosylaminopyrimidine deaminase/5-amino-6-(5-phosphoribosylamino)uracil reductase RibD [Sphingomonas naphthae]
MAVATALASRGRGRTAPNPNVGCVIVQDGRVIGRGWTQPGGRPHAEAMALDQAGEAARGATAYVTLEPCAHQSLRGPACADLLAEAGVARVVAALRDPDPRTDGEGFARLRAHGLTVDVGTGAEEARRAMAGFLTRRAFGRPHVTLKLGLSLDGKIALANGSSRWITGAPARAHAHLERARADAILVGRGTFAADAPKLDVRLRGLEERAPRRFILASTKPQIEETGWSWLPAPNLIGKLVGVDHLLIEGGAGVAASFLRDDLVDRLLLYRAPIVIGGDGLPGIGDLGIGALLDTHGRWALHDARMLGMDRLEVYERRRKG